MQVLILGAGYTGREIGKALAARATSVAGTTRSQRKAEDLKASGLRAILYDGQTVTTELAAAMAEATHLIQSIAPGDDGDPLFRADGPPLRDLMPRLQWAAYLSTVGVYGDHGGAWVDEDTVCRPVSVRSVERLTAEGLWQDFGSASGIPVAILRLSGIYGPGRNAFCNLADGTARRLIKPGQVFNRIRVEDIAAVTAFLSERSLSGIFNVTDDEPAPPQDIVVEAARLMGVEPPPETAFDTAVLSPMARSFYGENKRVSNARLRDLGFTFRFPDYRVSLAQLWQSDQWR